MAEEYFTEHICLDCDGGYVRNDAGEFICDCPLKFDPEFNQIYPEHKRNCEAKCKKCHGSGYILKCKHCGAQIDSPTDVDEKGCVNCGSEE